MANSPHVDVLVDLAAKSTLAVLYYRKSASGRDAKPRLVEPYSFSEGREDLLIRCYQLEHDGDAGESGWRFFMAHKIQHVEATRIPFRPRRKISLPTGEVTRTAEPNPHWQHEGRREYRDRVSDALADGRLRADEIFDLEEIKSRHKLTPDDVRFVHASLYHRCLGSILEDGSVSEDELEQIRFLHSSMRYLGWCVGD